MSSPRFVTDGAVLLGQISAFVAGTPFKRTVLAMAYSPIQIQERYSKSVGVGNVRAFAAQHGSTARRARGNSSRPTGSLRFPVRAAFMINGGTQLMLNLPPDA
jgi:hypothetical protein